MKNTQRYSICAHSQTREFHIFQSHQDDAGDCRFTRHSSLCGAMTPQESSHCVTVCATSEQMNDELVLVGDAICPKCLTALLLCPD